MPSDDRQAQADGTRSAVTIFAPTVAPFFKGGPITRTGGAETQIFYLSNMLAAAGVEVRVLTVNVDEDTHDDDPSSHLEVQNLWNSNVNPVAKAWRLVKTITASPSPIYVRSPSLVNAIVMVIARATRKRTVMGLSSDLNCVRLPSATLRNLWVRAAFKLSNQVLAQTRDQQRLISRYFGVESSVFHNIFNLERYSHAGSVDFHARDIDVIWIGSIDPRKGVESVVQLAEKNPELRFAVLGNPPPMERQFGESIADRLSKLPNVSMPGFIDPERMPEWFGRAKVLLHTSTPVFDGLTKEGFPNVFLEAWASRAIVVSLHLDPDGLLSEGTLGYRCTSVDDAAQLINNIVRDEVLWSEITERAETFVRGRDISNEIVRETFVGLVTGQNSVAAREVSRNEPP